MPTENVDLYGATNMADIILSRATGQFDIDWYDDEIRNNWSEQWICEGHLDEYGTGWHKLGQFRHWMTRHHTNKKACSIADGLGIQHHGLRPLVQGKTALSKLEARAILFTEGVLLHAGLRKFSTPSFYIATLSEFSRMFCTSKICAINVRPNNR